MLETFVNQVYLYGCVRAAASVAWFYLYVVRQRFELGYWPKPYHPDPKNAGHVLHHLSIYPGVLAVPLLAIGVVALVIWRRAEDARFRWWHPISLLAFSIACYLTVMFVDPGDYWTWFMD